MADSPLSPPDDFPFAVGPDGSLDALADGARGLLAWRAVRGTAWHAGYAEARQHDTVRSTLHSAEKARDKAIQARPDVDGVALAAAGIVVVTGLPRSGTSMLMQMLHAGGLSTFTDRTRTADASNPKGYYEHDAVKNLPRDASWVPGADGSVVKVVVPLLPFLPAGPTYRVVFLERDLGEVLRSQSAMLGRLGHSAATTADLRPVLARQVETALEWARATPRTEVLTVSHRGAIADPAGTAARLAAFLGGGLDEAAMAAAVDPTLHRERAS